MAECVQFVCSDCGMSVEAWSDGNPFYIDETGSKKYAYHPNHDELQKCIANDVPHLCLSCGEEIRIDSRQQAKVCPKCDSTNIVDTCSLQNVKCPKCEDGRLLRDDDFHRVS